MLFAGVLVHSHFQVIHESLPLGRRKWLITVRELPDRQVLLTPRLPDLTPELQDAEVGRPLRQRRLLQRRHALACGAADEYGQRSPLEDVHDHRCLPVLVVEGNLPLDGLTQVIEGLNAIEITLGGEVRYLHDVTAHLLKGLFSRRTER